MKSAIFLLAGHGALLLGALAEAYWGWHPTGTGYALVGVAAGFCYGQAFTRQSMPQKGLES